MIKGIMKKSLIFTIIMLFVGTSVFPVITGFTETNKMLNQKVEFTTEWWPMYGHDQNHSHYSTSAAPATKNMNWEYTTNNGVFSSPAVVNGKVYFGSLGKMICLNASTGDLLWNYTTPFPYDNVDSSPAVANGKVYFTAFLNTICLDASTGDLIWSYNMYNTSSSSPVVINGKVYVGCDNYLLFCLDAETGGLIWLSSAAGRITSSPAVCNGKVYVGSWWYNIFCFNASNGEYIWQYNTSSPIYYSSPTVAYGKVYIGAYNGNVYCLNALTGEFIWSTLTGDAVDSSPAVANGNIYIGSNDGKLYCLNASTGGLIWSTPFGDAVQSSPAVADGKIYIGSNDGKIYCLDALNGGLIWSFVTGGAVKSSPAVADEKVYVGSDDYHLYCFGKESNQPPNPPTIAGPAKAKIKIATSYNFTTTDLNDDTVSYFIDWGDQTNSGWVGPYSSGITLTKSHTWTKKGDYIIKAKAKDTLGNESDWGQLSVIMPYSYEPQYPVIQWLLERFPNAFPILKYLMRY
jgi:outer membrane protein assembly factor BamB